VIECPLERLFHGGAFGILAVELLVWTSVPFSVSGDNSHLDSVSNLEEVVFVEVGAQVDVKVVPEFPEVSHEVPQEDRLHERVLILHCGLQEHGFLQTAPNDLLFAVDVEHHGFLFSGQKVVFHGIQDLEVVVIGVIRAIASPRAVRSTTLTGIWLVRRPH